MPGTGESPGARLARASPLAGTPGQAYVERRGVPVAVADAAGVRFDPDFGGRPAVVAPLRDAGGSITSVHGRYLRTLRGQSKMLTVGASGGALSVLGGWRAKPAILVEGLFDALSLAVCGWASVATIGRWAPWLPEALAGRIVWIAFDATRPGEADAACYADRLRCARLGRLLPPGRSKDWSTALARRGAVPLSCWMREHLGGGSLA